MEKKKNKEKILIILSSIILVAIIIAVIVINVLQGRKTGEEFVLPKDEIEIARALIIPNEEGINLIGIDFHQFDLIEGNNIFRTSDNNEILYYKDGKINNLSVLKKLDANENETIFFDTKELMNVSNKVYDFIFNDEYIAILTDVTETEDSDSEETDTDVVDILKEHPLTNNHTNYNVIIMSRNSSEKYEIKNITCDEKIILVGNSFVYNTEHYLNSYNFKTNTAKQIYLGKNVTDFDVVNDNLIVFDGFGNGNNSSVIMKLDESLNILKASKHDAIKVNSIQSEASEKIIFIEQDENPIFYSLNMEEKKDSKQKSNLNTELEGIYTKDNTIYYRGYIYTGMNGKASIVDMKSSTIYKQYDKTADFVFPIFEEDIISAKTE